MQVTKSNDGDTIVSFTIFTSALTRITRELGITIGLKLGGNPRNAQEVTSRDFIKQENARCDILMKGKIAPPYWIDILTLSSLITVFWRFILLRNESIDIWFDIEIRFCIQHLKWW